VNIAASHLPKKEYGRITRPRTAPESAYDTERFKIKSKAEDSKDGFSHPPLVLVANFFFGASAIWSAVADRHRFGC
jgi:hypothetical protein